MRQDVTNIKYLIAIDLNSIIVLKCYFKNIFEFKINAWYDILHEQEQNQL